MHVSFRHLPAFFVGVVLSSFIVLGSSVLANRDSSEVMGDSDQLIPFEDLRAFSEVFHRIKNDYVEEVDDSELLQSAIKGMLNGLDPHSSYLDEEEYRDLQVGTSGEFGGLGIEVGMDESGLVKVISPIDDTPAQRAGIQPGDLILRLDETPVKGLTLNEAVKIMRGEPGTIITLTVVRETQDKPLKIKIERDIIKVKSVKQQLLTPGYGYIRISHFQSHTEDDLEKAITALEAENSGKLQGVVLDLRNNPGGVLNAAVDVSDAFLTDGLIVYTKGRVEDSSLEFKANANDRLAGAPMVVLVNSGSASASEIVAGALQDHKRAIIMGNKTFGKGSVQTILPMHNNGALKLTTARYYTPSGRSIQAEGIVPDITLNKLQISTAETDDFEDVTESQLVGHLDKGNKVEETSENEKESQPVESDEKSDKKEEPELAMTDYAVHEALNLLKGLNIIKAQKAR
jgi:carboxyl-terminal processing protease